VVGGGGNYLQRHIISGKGDVSAPLWPQVPKVTVCHQCLQFQQDNSHRCAARIAEGDEVKLHDQCTAWNFAHRSYCLLGQETQLEPIWLPKGASVAGVEARGGGTMSWKAGRPSTRTASFPTMCFPARICSRVVFPAPFAPISRHLRADNYLVIVQTEISTG